MRKLLATTSPVITLGSIGSRAPGRPTTVRLLLLLSLVLGLLAPVAPASAAPPIRDTQSGLSVGCDLNDGFVSVLAGNDDSFTYLEVFVETQGRFLFGFVEDVEVGDTTASGGVDLYDDSTGEFVGTATVDVTLTPAGPTESFSDRFRVGNVLERFTDEFTPATATGTIELDGELQTTIDVEDACSGSLFSFTFFATNPATFVDRVDERFLDCSVDGPNGSGFLFAFADDMNTFVDLFLQTADRFVYGFSEDASFTDGELSATLDLFDDDTGEPVGTADLAATLVESGSFVEDVQSPRETIKVTVTQYDVSGTITIDGATYELSDCFAESVEGRVRFTSPPGRGGGGRPATNDTPDDAILLDVPSETTVSTSATDEAPEASCTVVDEFDGEVFEFDVPITNTVWYVIEGTGDPITLDTAASAFDTVVGVYDDVLDPIVCVDDVDSLQARVTFDTVDGETYYVQVGGFGGDTGRLVLTVE